MTNRKVYEGNFFREASLPEIFRGDASKRFKTICCCCCYLVQPENGTGTTWKWTLLDAFHWMIKPPQISENERLFLAKILRKNIKSFVKFYFCQHHNSEIDTPKLLQGLKTLCICGFRSSKFSFAIQNFDKWIVLYVFHHLFCAGYFQVVLELNICNVWDTFI